MWRVMVGAAHGGGVFRAVVACILIVILGCYGAISYGMAKPTVIQDEETTVQERFCQKAIDLIIHFEISSAAYYDRRLARPTWPQGASGVTVGIGYDLGHQIKRVILEDWIDHMYREELAKASGVKGVPAKELAAQMQHVITPLWLAESVFTNSTVPRYWQMTLRAFPGVENLRLCAQGAMLSLAYNRGVSKTGSTRKEIRELADKCIPEQDYDCMASQFRSMLRLWKGTPIEAGMTRRREGEIGLLYE